jgi:hypothetical protein
MQYTPNPSGLKGNLLFGVSCSLATACTAGGYYLSGFVSLTFAERDS